MNTPNPLIPQGSLHQQKTGGPSSVRIAVVTVVAIHIVFFGGLLMQGCKRDNITTGASSPTNRNLTLPQLEPSTNFVTAPTNLPQAEPAPAPAAPIVATPEPVVTNTPVAPTESKEYTIVKGDLLYKIAKANGVTIGAITKANPKLDASRLKIGQKIVIPASTKTASTGGPEMAESVAAGGTHVVKAGETLTKIARQHATTVKALRAANGLKTDRLNVGQKLKLPASGNAVNPAPAI